MKMRTLRSLRFLLLVLAMLVIPATSFAQFGVSITVAPPELVVYAQPICPQEGYIWTPGYWAYGEDGYYWVPGTWVEPPSVDLLWTPGYWGWDNDRYAWNEGYWGPEVGFYGGVNYGFGYGGVGYDGGYWRNNQFSYNTYVNNVGRGRFHNTYNKRVNVNTRNYVSYNGGSGGLTTRPTAAEESAAHARHEAPTATQSGHQRAASQNHDLLASVNHGRPPIAATSKPGEFTGKGVVAARGSSAAHNATVGTAAATRTNENKAVENRSAENKAAASRTSENKAVENRSAENKAAATRANENKAVENRSAANKAAATRTTDTKASENRAAASQPTRNSERSAQPSARSEAPRPEAKPVRANPSASPARETAPPRTESAPRAPAPPREAAPRQAAAPKSEPSHQSAPKQEPTKSEPR